MKDSEKEQTKLLATMLNTLGANLIVIGFVIPVASILYKMPNAPSAGAMVPALFVWLVGGLVLHAIGRLILKGLDP